MADSGSALSRTPPVEVRRQLRQEVGFGCPVKGCGNPYLEYHHFDPPWEKEQHHDPERMIALCATHHAKAAAWTVADCRAMKAVPADRPDVRGKFEWMRQDVLAVVGGQFYYETPTMVEFRRTPLIWFERDDQRRLLLSLRMLSASGVPRFSLESNDWVLRGDPADGESPPNGSRLRVRYDNGDDMSIRFREWADADTLYHTYPDSQALAPHLRFPLVTCEITFDVGGTDIKFGPTATNYQGFQFLGNTGAYCQVGLSLG